MDHLGYSSAVEALLSIACGLLFLSALLVLWVATLWKLLSNLVQFLKFRAALKDLRARQKAVEDFAHQVLDSNFTPPEADWAVRGTRPIVAWLLEQSGYTPISSLVEAIEREGGLGKFLDSHLPKELGGVLMGRGSRDYILTCVHSTLKVAEAQAIQSHLVS